MNALTTEWIAKAEADLRTARREFAATDEPNYDAVCFHAQQAAEKCLKARLVEAGIAFPKTHDLGALVALAVGVEPTWSKLLGVVDALTDRAVEVRYPGVLADYEDGADSIQRAEAVRREVLRALGLPV